MSGEPTLADDKAGRNAKGETRRVFVYECPPELTEGDLRAQFPTATDIRLITREGKSTGTAALRFETVSEAKAFSKQQTVEVSINGRRVRLPMAMGGAQTSFNIAKKFYFVLSFFVSEGCIFLEAL